MMVALVRMVHSVVTRGPAGLFNDFFDYWGAGVLLNHGQNPYDVGALHAVQRAAGLSTETGTGYSYPVVFGQLMRPLALLSPRAAAVTFTGFSLIALLYAVALLLGSILELRWPIAVLGGVAAGLFPPVIGSLYFGQANLIVLLLLALAYRCVAPGPMLGLASAIKLYPLSGFLAFITERPLRWRPIRNGLAVFIVLLAVQLSTPGGHVLGPGGSLISPDTYWSNESINGWLSRLAIASIWTRPPVPGFPVEPLMLLAVLILTAVTIMVLWSTPNRPWEGALALSLWLGTVAAPKNSFWNFTPLLLGVVFAWTQLRGRWWLFAIGVAGWLLLELQAQLDSARDTIYQSSPALTWLSSAGLYGALILGAVTAYVVVRPGLADRPADRHAHRELDVGR